VVHPWLIDFALKFVLPLRDVAIQEPMAPLRRGNEYQGALTCIHKVKDNRDLYFFANSSPNAIDTKVVLRGSKNRASGTRTRRAAPGRIHGWRDQRTAGNHDAAGIATGMFRAGKLGSYLTATSQIFSRRDCLPPPAPLGSLCLSRY
jgi:hypothetical protein